MSNIPFRVSTPLITKHRFLLFFFFFFFFFFLGGGGGILQLSVTYDIVSFKIYEKVMILIFKLSDFLFQSPTSYGVYISQGYQYHKLCMFSNEYRSKRTPTVKPQVGLTKHTTQDPNMFLKGPGLSSIDKSLQ